MFPAILGGMALMGIGNLIRRRRAMRGSTRQRQGMQAMQSQMQAMQRMQGRAFGQVMNTQATTPTNSVGQAATSNPNTAQTPAGQANTGTPGTVTLNPVEFEGRQTVGSGQAQPQTPRQSGGDPNLASRLGQQSIERTRRRNRQQQSALGGQAMT